MENTNKKIDRRVIKTKRAIRNAFAKFLSEKNIDEITIKDIADEADVNRKTVYNYYNGTYEILEEIENELVASFEMVTKDINFKSKDDTKLIFERLTALLNEDIEFYGNLLSFNANSLILMKMAASLRTLIKEAFLAQNIFPSNKVDTIVDYIGSGMLGAYQAWFMAGKIQPIDEFSKDISALVFNGIEAFKNTNRH